MNLFEASKIIGCSLSHAHKLVRDNKLKARKEVILTRAGRPFGYQYYVTKQEAVRMSKQKQAGGWQRGKPRGSKSA